MGDASEKDGDRPAIRLADDSTSCSMMPGTLPFNLGVPLLNLP
jgi:hypothetical protein